MKSFFFAERKLVFVKAKSLESGVNSTAKQMDSENLDNVNIKIKINEASGSLRNRLALSNVLNAEDNERWGKKIDSIEAQATSEEDIKKLTQEFEQEHTRIKGMVDQYTQKVMTNKIEAFTSDTATEYVDWFAQQSYEEKMKAFKVLDDDIKERLDLRKKLLTRFKKTDVYQMERTEMRDKVKTLEQMEKNDAKYESLMKSNERYFHNPKEYIKQFKDQTLDEQARWLSVFETEYRAPRKALVDIYDKLPKKYQNDSEFLSNGLKEKQEFLDKLDMKIEKEYIKEVNDTNSDVMSQNSKRFAIVDFLRLDDVGMKAMYLEQLPKSIKAEKKLAKEYKDLNKEFKDPNTNKTIELPQYSQKEWEKLKFEDKEKLLLQMKAEAKLIEAFARILKQGLEDKAISEKTYERYMKIFTDTDLNGRSQLSRNSLSAMKTRRDLVEDFEKLDKETQNKFKNFYKRGHKARLQMFKEAQLFDSKNKASQTEEELKKQEEEKKDAKLKKNANVPQSLEQKDVQTIVAEMQKEADGFEATQQLERALDKHQDVLKLHPKNQYSLKKQNEIKDEIEAMDTLMDDEIEEAVAREANTSSAKEELDQIRLAQMILDDQEEVVLRNHRSEKIGKQKSHLSQDTFTLDVHEKLYEQSEGKKGLDKDGKVEKVEQIDLGTLGKSDIKKYQDKMKELKATENLSNLELVDENGRALSIKENRDRLSKRKRKEVISRAKRVKSSAKREDVINAAEKSLEEELAA